MAVGASGKKREWVNNLERELADVTSESALWEKHSVHRVPAAVKVLHPHAYRPQVVSLGPFHHGDEQVVPMEQHKRRAVGHLLRRTGRRMEDFVAAVEAVAPALEDAYQDLGDGWRGEKESRERFLRVMVTDGCFLLEIMRMANAGGRKEASAGGGRKDTAAGGGDGRPDEARGGYAQNDPVFGRHGALYMVPYVRRDMLIVENQLPLLVLEKLFAVVQTGGVDTGDVEYEVSKMVLRFISPTCKTPPAKDHRGLHPLDVFRQSLLSGRPNNKDARVARDRDLVDDDEEASSIIRSAAELYEAGIQFRKSKTESLHDVTFRHGVLRLPFIVVDDATEHMFLNLMAFERLHAGAGNDVTAYVCLMDSIVDSPADVALLTSRGIIQNAIGSDKAVARLFNGLCKDIVLDPASELDVVQRAVSRYCRQPCHVWRANLVHTYFRSPWAFLSLAAAVFLLGLTVMQTVYTVLQFYQGGDSAASSSAPAPL